MSLGSHHAHRVSPGSPSQVTSHPQSAWLARFSLFLEPPASLQSNELFILQTEQCLLPVPTPDPFSASKEQLFLFVPAGHV